MASVDFEKALFDLLEALSRRIPLIGGGFARHTGGVDLGYILRVIDHASNLIPVEAGAGKLAEVERIAIDQNDAMRQELAHVGNLVSDLARAMRVDQANGDGTWPDLAGRIRRLIDAALTTPAGGIAEGESAVIAAAQFLSDRLDNLEWMDGALEDTLRDYMGHVDPAHAHLKSALADREKEA